MSCNEKIACEKIRRQRTHAFEQALVLVDVERGDARRARGRMAGVRVAMEELDRAFRCRAHDRVVDALGNRDGAHRLRAVGERLGHRDDVRRHAEALRREIGAGAPEAR